MQKHMHTLIHIHTCVHVRIHTNTHTDTHTDTHRYTHTYINFTQCTCVKMTMLKSISVRTADMHSHLNEIELMWNVK